MNGWIGVVSELEGGCKWRLGFCIDGRLELHIKGRSVFHIHRRLR